MHTLEHSEIVDSITSGKQKRVETPQPGFEMPEMSPRTRLTSALHSGSFTCLPGISLMAEDRLPLHEVTLLWYVRLERLASDFFSDAVGGNRKISELKLKGRAHISSTAGLAVKGPSRAWMLHACCQREASHVVGAHCHLLMFLSLRNVCGLWGP